MAQLLLFKDSELAQFIYTSNTIQVANTRQGVFHSQLGYYLKELSRTGVTRQLLWQEYILSCPQGYAYTQFCERLKQGKRLRTVECIWNTIRAKRYKLISLERNYRMLTLYQNKNRMSSADLCTTIQWFDIHIPEHTHPL